MGRRSGLLRLWYLSTRPKGDLEALVEDAYHCRTRRLARPIAFEERRKLVQPTRVLRGLQVDGVYRRYCLQT